MSVPYCTLPYQVKYSTVSLEAYRNVPTNAGNLRTGVVVLAKVDISNKRILLFKANVEEKNYKKGILLFKTKSCGKPPKKNNNKKQYAAYASFPEKGSFLCIFFSALKGSEIFHF